MYRSCLYRPSGTILLHVFAFSYFKYFVIHVASVDLNEMYLRELKTSNMHTEYLLNYLTSVYYCHWFLSTGNNVICFTFFFLGGFWTSSEGLGLWSVCWLDVPSYSDDGTVTSTTEHAFWSLPRDNQRFLLSTADLLNKHRNFSSFFLLSRRSLLLLNSQAAGLRSDAAWDARNILHESAMLGNSFG